MTPNGWREKLRPQRKGTTLCVQGTRRIEERGKRRYGNVPGYVAVRRLGSILV